AARIAFERQPEAKTFLAIDGVERYVGAVEDRPLEPQVQRLRFAVRAHQPGLAHRGDSLRMRECLWEAETPRVPVPAMDAVVVTGKLSEGPAAIAGHAEAIDSRRLGDVRRCDPRLRRAWLAEPAAMEEGGAAFP